MAIGQGNRIRPDFRCSIALAILRAAARAVISNGAAAASIGVIAVATNPGQIVVTAMPRFRKAIRSPSMYRFTAALLAQ